MTIIEKINLDLRDIVQPELLEQIADFISFLKQKSQQPNSNRAAILALAGSLSDSDAEQMRQTINTEFNNIEGDW